MSTCLWYATGLDHLPDTGGAIVAANHLSIADQLFLAILTPRHVAFWAKAEYFRASGPRGQITRRVVSGMGAIPVERTGGRSALSAFDAAVPVLRSGGLVAVFPEGTRSPDGRLYRGRTGAVRLAQQAGVPIIPVGIRGTDGLRPPGARLPRRRPISVSFGPALPVHLDAPSDIRRLTDTLMATIQSLSAQEYVPWYARTRGEFDVVAAHGYRAGMPGFEEITRHHDPDPAEDPWVNGPPRPETVAIAPYNPEWPRRYQDLSTAIRTALGPVTLNVEHVGSTSVEGLAAKDVIDIDLTVADPRDEDRYVPALERLGYVLTIREPSFHQHRCLRLDRPRVNLHVFGPDCPETIRHRMFRDWLRAHPDDRALYEEAKREAIPGGGHVMDYNARKQQVIREIYDRLFHAAGML